MDYAERRPFEPDARFDDGDLDCGNGLLLLIRQHIDPLHQGLTPDCGFGTFADNPVASAPVAQAKLRAVVEAAGELRKR